MLLLYVAYTIGLTTLVCRLGLWSNALLGTTILWFCVSGLVLLFQANNVGADPRFFRKAALKTMGLAAIFEFFVNVKTFHLLVELPLQVIIALLVGVQVLSSRDPQYAQAKRVANGLLVCIGLVLLILTGAAVVRDWSTLDHTLLWRSLVLPIWLTLGTLPVVYVVALLKTFKRERRAQLASR